jgi:hypothetical protein
MRTCLKQRLLQRASALTGFMQLARRSQARHAGAHNHHVGFLLCRGCY